MQMPADIIIKLLLAVVIGGAIDNPEVNRFEY
jgi:hypothetical protein